MEEIKVTHNETGSRFEHGNAKLEYVRRGDAVYMVHTEVPPELEGRGVAGALARAALDFASEAGLRVVPRCPFVAAYIKRHPEYQRLVAS